MPEQTPRTLNHFSLVRFTDSYWREPQAQRRRIHCAWLTALREAADVMHLYQTYPAEAGNDLLIWCALAGEDSTLAARFFPRFAAAAAPHRAYVTVTETLWGFTRPSQYTKTRSQQEVDPFTTDRLPYLIMYPFVKTTDWYLKDREERQRMMSQHIKVGKQYKDITQLLLYSFGLQDQEFVVVYETRDLLRFLDLVAELRATEARLYTERDYPLHAGVHQPSLEALAGWL
jgi:chlorite dismutase